MTPSHGLPTLSYHLLIATGLLKHGDRFANLALATVRALGIPLAEIASNDAMTDGEVDPPCRAR
jgi:hypothetical protein